ncbi:MAG TPA: DUF6340 family protein [Bacteroidia bacterium]|nr:DUF6340 family protein [Bacteroidia bacterium]
MKSFLLVTLSILTFASCKTDLITLRVMNPAPVTIPSYVKNVGIVNRSIPGEEDVVLNTIHKINSLDYTNLNKEGSEEAIKGLQDALTETSKFSLIKSLDLKLKSPGAGIFSSPLSWIEIEKICRENNLDALIILELFDNDVKVAPIAPPKDLSNPLAVVSSIQQQVNITTTVKTGWRIYDPKSKLILDEYSTGDQINYTGAGGNLLQTAEAIVSRKEAVKKLSNQLGYLYVNRMLPYWLNVRRDYYVKGSSNFKIAKRKAQTGNWEQAGKLWEQETKNAHAKIAGRAYYNMAIINEINGNTDVAIEWAQKSYEDYNNRLALKYVNVLKYRKLQNNRLNQQQQQQQNN